MFTPQENPRRVSADAVPSHGTSSCYSRFISAGLTLCVAGCVWICAFLQVPAPPVRRTPAPTWASASSSGRTTPATAPWPPTLARSATTVSCLTVHGMSTELLCWSNILGPSATVLFMRPSKQILYAIIINSLLFFLISWDNIHLWQRRRSNYLWVANQWEAKHQDRSAHCWIQHLPEGRNPGPDRQRTWSWWLPHVAHSKF